MEDVKQMLVSQIAGKLAAAPDSIAKSELVEELSENLYARYLDMTASGMAGNVAFECALDNLGNTDDLVDYLNSLDPDQPLPELEPPSGWPSIDDLDKLFKNVEEVVRGAVGQAKSVIQDVKGRLREDGFLNFTSPGGRVAVNIFKGVDKDKDWPSSESPVSEEEEAAVQKLSAQDKDRIYGFGYDKTKGGFFTQWGEWKGARLEPISDPGEGIPSHALRGIDLQTHSGSVIISMDQEADGDVVIGGDIPDLEVSRSDDGVLTIRPCRTASSSFFFHRGLSTARVTLSLPRRQWDFLKITTVNGDITVGGEFPVGLVAIKTSSGDVEGRLIQCERLDVALVSGDTDWRGDVGEARLESVSGDLLLDGRFGPLSVSSISGDVEIVGGVDHLRASMLSGDLSLESHSLPRGLELSSKSGDLAVRIPDHAPFSVRFKTVSGDLSSDFLHSATEHRQGTLHHLQEENGPGPVYRLSTVSGDLSLRKY